MMSRSSNFPTEISTGDLARLLGITSSRIGQLVEERVLKRTARGQFNAAAAVQGFIEHKIRGAERAAAATDFGAARTSLMQARAKLAELERKEREGELIPRVQIEPAFLAVASTVRDRMLAIPSKTSARVGMCKTVVEVQTLLRAEIEQGLNEIASMPILVDGKPVEPQEDEVDES
jgi:phage terminase Nu1 subunit (DNA packaging protein)